MGLMERIKLWFRGFNYKEIPSLVKEYQKNPTVGDAALNVFLGALVTGATVFLYFVIWGSIYGTQGLPGQMGVFLTFAIIYAIAIIIFALAFFLISEGVYWVLAKALGGKGAYAHQVQVASLPRAACMALAPIFFIPCIGSIISMVASFYQIFLIYLIIKEVHKLSGARAAVVVLIPVALAAVAFALLLLYLTPMAATPVIAPA